MVSMIKRHEVQVLLATGYSQRLLTNKAGVSKRSLMRIALEPPPLEAWVEADRHLPTLQLLHQLRERGSPGGKTAVYDVVRRLRRPTPSWLISRFGGLSGESWTSSTPKS